VGWMTNDKLSALISLGAAIVIVGATFFQWWDITYNGGMVMRGWIRVLLVVVLMALSGAAVLLFV
jgi:hypothetical protein